MEKSTYPWQSPLFMKRVLGVDGALSGAVRQKCATCSNNNNNNIEPTKKRKRHFDSLNERRLDHHLNRLIFIGKVITPESQQLLHHPSPLSMDAI